MPGPGLYVHVPFCHSDCTYCSFYRVSYRESAADAFLCALERELSSVPRDPRPATLYVGGGTPSALREGQLERLLTLLEPYRAPGQEFTVEVNPLSARAGKIAMLQAAGVSRVSFGVQTFDAVALQMLGRSHSPDDIERTFGRLRGSIPSISFDLIFAHPGQTLEAWSRDLRAAIRLGPDHLSVYSLIHEPNTPLTRAIEAGTLRAADEELERAMFLETIDQLEGAGFEHYEVSSYSRPGHRSQHNQAYWRQQDYVGVGPGATGTLGNRRYTNARSLEAYVREIEASGVPPREEERLTAEDRIREHILLALRTREGLSLDAFEALAGRGLEEYCGGKLSNLLELGLVHESAGQIRLTRNGLCVADRVIVELMA